MTITKLLLVGVFAGVVLWGANRHFDPYSAELPLDSTDLSPIQGKLNKLPQDEQALVQAYVQRTGGRSDSDSMLVSAQLAAMPNLKEAITRQKAWLAKEATLNTEMNAQFAAYNAKFDAMRKALQIELVDTKSSRDQGHTFRFKNTATQTIEAFEARVLVRPASLKLVGGGGSIDNVIAFAYPYAPNSLVYITAGVQRPTLIPFASVEIHARSRFMGGMPSGELDGQMILETYPTYIRFTGGKELKMPDDVVKNTPRSTEIYYRLLKE